MQKFDAEEFYNGAMSGKPFDYAPLIDFVKSFPQVVLWGASLLGKAVQRCLGMHGIPTSLFWDLRYAELKVDGEVTAPFAKGCPEDTIVILCVGNAILQPEIIKEIKERHYTFLLGDLVYQALGCPFTTETGIDADACLRGSCRAIYCKRLASIVKSKYPPNGDIPLFLPSATLVVNQVCSLSCKYCTSYMNRYPIEERRNFTLHELIHNITTFFKSVDSVGTITIMGGEPFLHPDISEITHTVLNCGNFGVISISTSGTCTIKPRQLTSLKDKRVNVSFSNYLSSLSEKQKSIFYNNIKLLEDEGVPHTIGATGPYWIIPSTLESRKLGPQELMEKKQGCICTMQVKNDKIYPCDFANAVHSLRIEHYPDSMVAIGRDPQKLRKQIINFLRQPYYTVCERCKGFGGATSQAGEQGFVDLMNTTTVQ